MSYIEPRNRLKLLDQTLHNRILDARNKFHEELPSELRSRMNTYDVDTYNSQNSVQDNILFGRITHGIPSAVDKVQELIRNILIERELEDDIFKVGLEFDIGTGGKRLSENLRQRIVVARALMKGSDMLIINRGLNTLDMRAQQRLVEKILSRARGESGHKPFGLLWVLATPNLSQYFDTAMMFEKQSLVAMEEPEILKKNNQKYAALVS